MAILQVLEGLSSETDCSIFSVEDHGETPGGGGTSL